jgi:DNA invertase Pin-like site-specific DNA recombinase
MNTNLENIIKKYTTDVLQTDTIETKIDELDSLLKNIHIHPQYSLVNKNINKVESILSDKIINGKRHYHIKWANDELNDTTWEPIENISRYTLQLYHLSQETIEHNKNIVIPSHNAYLYLRTSKTKTHDGQVSIEVQKNDLKTYCKTNNIGIKGMTMDEGTSARNMKNLEGLHLILDKILPGDVLMIWDISRFSRNSLQALHLLETLSLKNIHTYFLKENVSYQGAMNKHYVRQALSTSQLHSDTVSEKVKAAIQYKKQKGNYIGQAKYGYTIKKIGGIRKLVKYDKEQSNIKLVKTITNQYKKDYNIGPLRSLHYNIIAGILNTTGAKFRGRPFTQRNISLLISR